MELFQVFLALMLRDAGQVPDVNWALFGGSVLLILWHFEQEILDAGGPIWEYLGLTNSWVEGLSALTLFCTVQMFASFCYLILGNANAGWLLATVWGADFFVSHFIPSLIGFRPNPGFGTSWGYFIGSVTILFTNLKGIYG